MSLKIELDVFSLRREPDPLQQQQHTQQQQGDLLSVMGLYDKVLHKSNFTVYKKKEALTIILILSCMFI